MFGPMPPHDKERKPETEQEHRPRYRHAPVLRCEPRLLAGAVDIERLEAPLTHIGEQRAGFEHEPIDVERVGPVGHGHPAGVR